MNDKEKIGLFCFDGPMYRDRNGRYCSTTLTDEMFSRFFTVVDKLFVAIRVFEDTRTCEEMHMKYIASDKITIIPVGNVVSAKGLFTERKKFKKMIENTVANCDLVFARMPSIISNTIAEVCIEMDKPYLVEVGGCCWDAYKNHGIQGKMVAPLVYYWERKYVSKAAYATYVTKEFLQHRYPNNNVTTNCSNVYLQEQETKVLEERINKIRGNKLSTPVFGQVVASIEVKYKGEQYFIRAMRELKKRGIIVKFEIVGPGSEDYLKKEAELYGVADQVIFLGAKKKEEVFNWLKTIDVYIQPSKQEGLPRSVIEAMSVGCPCLGSNIAGIPELLEKDCLFNPDNTKQLADCVEYLLDGSNMEQKARTNFEKAKEYNVKDIEKRRQAIFTKYSKQVFGR